MCKKPYRKESSPPLERPEARQRAVADQGKDRRIKQLLERENCDSNLMLGQKEESDEELGEFIHLRRGKASF